MIHSRNIHLAHRDGITGKQHAGARKIDSNVPGVGSNDTLVDRVAKNADRWCQLLRYHHPSQLLRRAWNISKGRAGRWLPYRPKANGCTFRPHASSLLSELRQRRSGLWPHRSDSRRLQQLAAGVFQLLNQSIDLNVTGQDARRGDLNWNPDASRLWRFHLQCQEYLTDLVCCDSGAAWRIVQSWLRCPQHQSPRSDPDAWHPFCISRRIPVWLMLAAYQEPPQSLADTFWTSVAEQTQWLADHLEWDLGGNHLLENLCTVLLADCCLEGDWSIDRAVMLKMLMDQLEQQILPTGEHFERTPTYHALMLLSLADTARTLKVAGHDEASLLDQTVSRMSGFLNSILHPDGGIPLFADSVFQETPEPRLLLRRVDGDRSSPAPADHGDDYWTWRNDRGDYLICDLGPLAADHLPAHGHADLFNLEASVGGHRMIVDTGTFCYEASLMRSLCRGTAAHNTMQVDNEDHADTWSSFRMGRRGHPIWIDTGSCGSRRWMLACHDAYRHRRVPLTGRLIVASEGPSWIIIDWLIGRQQHCLTSRMNIHPDWKVAGNQEKSLLLRRESANVWVAAISASAEIQTAVGCYCPNFGVREDSTMLSIDASMLNQGWVGWVFGPRAAEQQIAVQLTRHELTVAFAEGEVETWSLRNISS